MRNLFFKFFLWYLKTAARIQLWKIKPTHIIGITGSAGKTSAKEAVYAILQDKFVVKEPKKSYNSEIGLPLDILELSADYASVQELGIRTLLLTPIKLLTNWNKYDVFLAEMGVDKPGDMDYLLSFLRPTIGVFLNALPVHTANFNSGIMIPADRLEAELTKRVAGEKGKLIKSLPVRGTAILNVDDPNVIAFEKQTNARVMTFGKENASVENFIIDLPDYLLAPEHGATLAAATCVGMALGMTKDDCVTELKTHLQLPPGRMTVLKGVKETTLLDSTYNSSPVPTIAALKVLHTFQPVVIARNEATKQSSPKKNGKVLAKSLSSNDKTRKIAILGDMRELGDLAKLEHEKVAREVMVDADFVFTFGPLMQQFAEPIFKGDFAEKYQTHTDMSRLITAVTNFLDKGDVVLIKGSQNTIMLETLVEKLLANSEDVVKLCRRGEFWEKKRKELLISN